MEGGDVHVPLMVGVRKSDIIVLLQLAPVS